MRRLDKFAIGLIELRSPSIFSEPVRYHPPFITVLQFAHARMIEVHKALPELSRHTPDPGDFRARIAPLTGSGNGKSPSAQARSDRNRRLTAMKHQTCRFLPDQGAPPPSPLSIQM